MLRQLFDYTMLHQANDIDRMVSIYSIEMCVCVCVHIWEDIGINRSASFPYKMVVCYLVPWIRSHVLRKFTFGNEFRK